MKKTTNYLLPLLFLALISGYHQSCNRPVQVPECCYDCSCHSPCVDGEHFTYPYTDTLYLSDSFLSYWYFPVGSWWVYKRLDTTADVYDTARVVDQDRGIACDCKLLGDVCRERAMQTIDHTYHFVDHTQTPTHDRFSVRMDTELRIDWIFISGPLGGGGGPHVTVPFMAAEKRGYSVRYERKETFKTSVYAFKDPVTYHYQNPRIPADSIPWKTNVLVKDVGWVYFYDRDNSEWELVDYHIIQN